MQQQRLRTVRAGAGGRIHSDAGHFDTDLGPGAGPALGTGGSWADEGAQREADDARGIYHLRAIALERMHEYGVTTSWTRFRWNGEARGDLSIAADCRPPAVNLGFDFRETASGSLEMIHGRSNNEPVTINAAVDPVVIVDVDADGRLEVIEAAEIFYRLRSFDGTEQYVCTRLTIVDEWHCPSGLPKHSPPRSCIRSHRH